MAEIEIVYREYSCEYNPGEFCVQCMTGCAEDLGCKYFYGQERYVNEKGMKVIPFGDCQRYRIEYKFKGWTGKRYEMEEQHDPYNPNLDGMMVTLGSTVYDCVKVTLNGQVIFNDYDEDVLEDSDERRES